MKRREFLTNSAAAGLTLAAGSAAHAAAANSRKELLELRLYKFSSAAKQQAFDSFLGRVAIPALNRAGIRPVGVFKLSSRPTIPTSNSRPIHPTPYVLLPHKSMDSVVNMIDRLAEDYSFTNNAGELVDAPSPIPR